VRDIRKLQESNLTKLPKLLINGGADGTRTREDSNEISNLLNPKEGESPFDPYDPRILHQISHYLEIPGSASRAC
jgi:hypothetical protein